MTGPSPATGRAGGHHGELLQGVFLDPDGRPQHGLVTLPVPGHAVQAVYVPDPDAPHPAVTVDPADRRKAGRAARLAVTICARRAGVPACGGHLELRGTLPIGLGMGSSTSDVVAAIRAVAAAHTVVLTPAEIARLAVSVERASDPTMFDPQPMLFAQRRGRVLEVFGDALPPVVVVGCVTGGGRPVDTLTVATPALDVATADLDAFEDLRDLLRASVVRGDTVVLARVATASAQLHQERRPLPELELVSAIGDEVGACGVQVAHSGNVAGLLFDPRDPETSRRVERAVVALAAHGLEPAAPFTVPPTARGGPSWTTTSARPLAVPISSGSNPG